MSTPSNLMQSYVTSNSIYRILLIFLSGTFVVFICKDCDALSPLTKGKGVDNYLFFIPVTFFLGVLVDSISVVIYGVLMYIKEWRYVKKIFDCFRVVRAYKEFSAYLWPALARKLNFRDENGIDREYDENGIDREYDENGIDRDYLEDIAPGYIFYKGDDRIFKWVVGHQLIAVLNRHALILLFFFSVISMGGWCGWTLAVIVLLVTAFASIYWHYYIMMAIFRWCYINLMIEEKGETA